MDQIQFERMTRKFGKLKIPVFGDTHGDIEGMFKVLQSLQQRNSERYDYVLQTGDFGFFPDKGQHKKEFRSEREAGVNRYLSSDELYIKYFTSPSGNKKLYCKVIFVRGNHEDRDALRELENKVPEGLICVDKNEKIFYLPDGRAFSITTGPESDILIAGFGGVASESRRKAFKRNPAIAFSEKGLDKLLETKAIDVLLTHQGTSLTLKGDKTIDSICELVAPKIHLHGHSHTSAGPYDLGKTKSYALAKLPDWQSVHSLGFYGFLECDPSLAFIQPNQLLVGRQAS